MSSYLISIKQVNLTVAFSGLNLMSDSAIFLVWFQKAASNEICLNHLKHEAKQIGLTLLRNKDKNTYIRAVVSLLEINKGVSIAAGVALDKVSQDDVSVTQRS